MQLSKVFNDKSAIVLAVTLAGASIPSLSYETIDMIDPLGQKSTPDKIEQPEINTSIDAGLYKKYSSLTQEKLKKVYEKSVYLSRENEVLALEYVFKSKNISQKDIQDIRDASLLHLAEVYVDNNINLALKYGANIDVKNKEGQRLDTIILGKGISRFKSIIDLHNNYSYDIQPLLEDSKGLWKLFSTSSFEDKEEYILTFLMFLYDKGSDLSIIQEPYLGMNLRDIAEKNKAQKIIDFLDKKQVKFSNHKPLVSGNGLHASYLKYSGSPLVSVTVNEQKLTDFPMYGKIAYNHTLIPDNHRKSFLYVAEHSTIFSHGLDHIKSTGGIASAIDVILTGKDVLKPINVLTIRETPPSYRENALTSLLNYNNFNDYQIVSVSMGDSLGEDVLETYQSSYSLYNEGYLRRTDKRPIVFYKAVGNEGIKPCIEIDKVSFCVQHHADKYHHKKAVLVGAARKEKNGKITVEEYSSSYPTFCSFIPYQSMPGGLLQMYYQGTSFTAPAAASIEKNLADIFARSASFPEGVVHEDILMALSLTAETDGLIDERTEKVVPIFKNVANLPMTDRCGSGVIQPQKAVDLLTKMVEWTRNDNKIEPTHINEAHFNLKASGQKKQGEKYVYTLKVPESGIITKIRAGIPFEKNKRGAALLQIGDSKPVALNLSSSGLTTAFHFAGYQFKKGETFKLITTKPIKHTEYNWEKAKPFLDLYTASINSPIKKAIEYTKQKRKILLAQ